MTVKDLGGGSVGSLMPSTLAALGAAEGAIAAPMADVQAQITGAFAASASVSIQPPSIDLTAALSAAVTLPGVAIDVSMMSTLVAELGVELAALEAALELVGAVTAPLTSVGVHAWEIEDQIGNMGPALGGVLAGGIPGGAGPAQSGVAIVIVAADAGAIAALRTLFAI